MPEHLSPAAGRIGAFAERVQQNIQRSLAHCHRQRHIPVVRNNVIDTDIERPRAAKLRRLMTRGGDHEMDFALAAQQPQPIINFPRQQHPTKRAAQFVSGEAKRLMAERLFRKINFRWGS